MFDVRFRFNKPFEELKRHSHIGIRIALSEIMHKLKVPITYLAFAVTILGMCRANGELKEFKDLVQLPEGATLKESCERLLDHRDVETIKMERILSARDLEHDPRLAGRPRPLVYVKTVDLPHANAERAAELKALLRSLNRKIINENTAFQDQRKLNEKKNQWVSELLEAMGVRHVVFQRGVSTYTLVLPKGDHPWNQFAGRLYRNHGTLVAMGASYNSIFQPHQNIWNVHISQMMAGEPGPDDLSMEKTLVAQMVSEPLIWMDHSKPEEGKFILDPNNLIPNGLRFMNFITLSHPIIQVLERFSFRSGYASDLAAGPRRTLEFLELGRNGRKLLTVAMRSPNGKWVESKPQEVPLDSNDIAQQVGQAIGDLQDNHMTDPEFHSHECDFFLLVAGGGHISQFDVRILNQLFPDNVTNVNSLSIVKALRSEGKVTYQIHTHSPTSAPYTIDTTVFADQLKLPYNKDRLAKEHMNSTFGIPRFPFNSHLGP